MSGDGWTGRRAQQARAIVRTWLPAPCGRCSRTVTGEESWVVGHKVARSADPSLIWTLSNWQPEHRECSDRSAQSAVMDKARREGALAVVEVLDQIAARDGDGRTSAIANAVRTAIAEGLFFP